MRVSLLLFAEQFFSNYLSYHCHPFTRVGKQEHPKVACSGKIPAAPLGCPPLPAILYMSPGFFEGGSYGRLAGERFVFAHSRTLGMLLHALTQVIQMLDAHVPRARTCEGSVAGSWVPNRAERRPRVVV